MFKSKIFKSNKDSLSVYVFGNAIGNFTLYYITEKGETTALYTRSLNGNYEFSYNFDPAFLCVYNNAKSFYFEITGEGSLSNYKIYSKKTPIAKSSNYSALNSDGTAKVKLITGDIVHVPVIPDKAVFIGNSLLLGMGSYGMCATNNTNDYAYKIIQKFQEKAHYFTYEKVHGSAFECSTNTTDFDNWFFNDPNVATGKPVSESLTLNTELVIIQLMDNVNTPDKVLAFKQNAERLITQIKIFSPHARIIWVYGWYYKEEIASFLLDLLKKWKIESVNIFDLHVEENEAKSGQISLDENGNPFTVKDGWITHPGDKGMNLIADRILNKIFGNKLK